MTTPDEQAHQQPAASPGPGPGNYGEISPGVPRYGQYAPEGWVPPSAAPSGATDSGVPSNRLPAASAYPGYQGGMGGAGSTGDPTVQTHLAAPRQVVLASRLLMVAGALQTLSGLLLLLVLFMPALRSTMVDALKAAVPSGPVYADAYNMLADPSFVAAILITATVISLVGAAIYFWLAVKIRKGANWARVTGLVLACISLFALVQPNILTIVQIGLGVGAMVILYRSPAKEYFAKRGFGKGPHGY